MHEHRNTRILFHSAHVSSNSTTYMEEQDWKSVLFQVHYASKSVLCGKLRAMTSAGKRREYQQRTMVSSVVTTMRPKVIVIV
jgi:hypothetical protein